MAHTLFPESSDMPGSEPGFAKRFGRDSDLNYALISYLIAAAIPTGVRHEDEPTKQLAFLVW